MDYFITNAGNIKMLFNQAAEYIMIVAPHQNLYEIIMDEKHDFTYKFNCKIASSTKPHITLLKFSQPEIVEDRVIKYFQQIARGQPHIEVNLKDYGSFPSHTIYINVTSKAPLLHLSKSLRKVRPLLKFRSEFRPFFLTEPHLTIARRLEPWQFEKASLEYKNMKFTGHFVANKMTLLKRRNGDESYQHVQDFEFLNIPTKEAIQICLFD